MTSFGELPRNWATNLASIVSEPISRTVDELRTTRIEQEAPFTDRMLGAIRERIHGLSRDGITWTAKTLTDRGSGSQESRYGADFMGVLNVDAIGYKVSKGFLAQAKLIRPGMGDDARERRRLVAQCQKMLRLTREAFVAVYTPRGVQFASAEEVVEVGGNLDQVRLRSAEDFFADHFRCNVGDQRIQCATANQLELLADEFDARSAVRLEGRQVIGGDNPGSHSGSSIETLPSRPVEPLPTSEASRRLWESVERYVREPGSADSAEDLSEYKSLPTVREWQEPGFGPLIVDDSAEDIHDVLRALHELQARYKSRKRE